MLTLLLMSFQWELLLISIFTYLFRCLLSSQLPFFHPYRQSTGTKTSACSEEAEVLSHIYIVTHLYGTTYF